MRKILRVGFSGQRDYAILILNNCLQIASQKSLLQFIFPPTAIWEHVLLQMPGSSQLCLLIFVCLRIFFLSWTFSNILKPNKIAQWAPQIFTTQLQQLSTFCHYYSFLYNFCKFMDIKWYTCYFLKILFLHFSNC